jgi:hypothetical protein
MTEAMVSLSEAARRSGMATTTIRRWIETGKLDGTLRTATGGYFNPSYCLDWSITGRDLGQSKRPSTR